MVYVFQSTSSYEWCAGREGTDVKSQFGKRGYLNLSGKFAAKFWVKTLCKFGSLCYYYVPSHHYNWTVLCTWNVLCHFVWLFSIYVLCSYRAADETTLGCFFSWHPLSPHACTIWCLKPVLFLYQNVKLLVAENKLNIWMGHCLTSLAISGSLRVTVITAAFKLSYCQRISHRPCESQH